MRIYENGIIRELTKEETAEVERQTILANVLESSRPFTDAEITDLFIKQNINTLKVDDNTALRMKGKYPDFKEIIGKELEAGFKFTYKDALYKVISAHTAMEAWLPDEGTESLYARIDEAHAGTLEDPIPYHGNMALMNGMYYVQDDHIYKCIRDTVNPVYNRLADLAGTYVEAVL